MAGQKVDEEGQGEYSPCPLYYIPYRGACGKTWVVQYDRQLKQEPYVRRSDMPVMLSINGSRGDVGPMAALAVQVRGLGAEVRVCAPPDFAERLVEAGLPVRQWAAEATQRPPAPA